MNFGGLLRQAIVSGQFRRVVEVSRELMDAGRRDRALADLNARGGVGGRGGRSGPEGAVDYLRSTGVDPAANQRFMDTGQMYEGDFNPAFESGRLLGFDAPGGRVGFLDPVTGSRSTQAWRGGAPDPIQAPYEGMRVIPGGTRMGEPATDWGFSQPPSKWMGRGQGTSWEYGFPRGEALETTGPWEWGPDDMSYFPTDWGYSSGFGGWNWPWKFGGMYPSRPFGEPPVVRGYDGGVPF